MFISAVVRQTKQTRLARCFADHDTLKERGNAAENEWAKRQESTASLTAEKLLKDLGQKLSNERKNEYSDSDNANVDDVLEDRDFLQVNHVLPRKS